MSWPEDMKWWPEATSWAALEEYDLRDVAWVPTDVLRKVAQAARLRHPGAVGPDWWPTLRVARRLTDPELLAVPWMGRKRLQQWRAWLATHPSPPPLPLPSWMFEE